MMIRVLLASICLLPVSLHAADLVSVYLKNAGTKPMHVWVNGKYQGYLKPREIRYTVSDGFITQESGNGKTGNPVKESHAGWDNGTGKTTITYQFGDEGQKSSSTFSILRGSPGMQYVASNVKGEKLVQATEEEMENASPILKASKPNLDLSEWSKNGDANQEADGSGGTTSMLSTFYGEYAVRGERYSIRKTGVTNLSIPARGELQVKSEKDIYIRILEKDLDSSNPRIKIAVRASGPSEETVRGVEIRLSDQITSSLTGVETATLRLMKFGALTFVGGGGSQGDYMFPAEEQ